MKSFLLLAVAVAAIAAPPSYKVQSKIKIGGGARWDYVYVDSANHRLYVSHGTQTEVVDTTTDKLITTIPDTKGVHGIAVADDLGKGFISNGQTNDVTIFDAKTGEVYAAALPVGGKPEFAQVDGKGHVYVNIEDKNEVIEINAKDATVA